MIIELISSSKDEIVTKVTQIPTDTIISTSGPSIWNIMMPYAIFTGSVIIFGVGCYFYYTSGSKGSSPDFTSIDSKKLQEVITKKIEDKSSEIGGYIRS